MSSALDSADPQACARDWKKQGFGVAIATVVKTWGSAPRPAGSQLAVREDGAFEGSVSGGCIEGDVIVESEEVIRTGRPKRLEYGVSNATAWEVGLACGGRIVVYLEPLSDA